MKFTNELPQITDKQRANNIGLFCDSTLKNYYIVAVTKHTEHGNETMYLQDYAVLSYGYAQRMVDKISALHMPDVVSVWVDACYCAAIRQSTILE